MGNNNQKNFSNKKLAIGLSIRLIGGIIFNNISNY